MTATPTAEIIEIARKELAAHAAVRTAKTRKELTAAKKLAQELVGTTTAAICEHVGFDQVKYAQIKDALAETL